jgi:hypothetical protein
MVTPTIKVECSSEALSFMLTVERRSDSSDVFDAVASVRAVGFDSQISATSKAWSISRAELQRLSQYILDRAEPSDTIDRACFVPLELGFEVVVCDSDGEDAYASFHVNVSDYGTKRAYCGIQGQFEIQSLKRFSNLLLAATLDLSN